jgi:hypothetical protein
MKYLYLYTLLFSLNSFSSDCIKSVDKYIYDVTDNGSVFMKKSINHTPVFAEDSCGSKGCEIFVFTKLYPGCTIESLNTKGFYIQDGLRSNSIQIKINKKTL